MARIVKSEGSYGIHPEDFLALHIQPDDDVRLECVTMLPEITFRLRVNGQDVPCVVANEVSP